MERTPQNEIYYANYFKENCWVVPSEKEVGLDYDTKMSSIESIKDKMIVLHEYCTPSNSGYLPYDQYYYINNFQTFNGIQNIENMNSGLSDGGYEDFTQTHILKAEPGMMINFQIDCGNYNGSMRIWIDWDDDGLFDDNVEWTGVGVMPSHNGSFVIPTVTPGTYRMRIVMQGNRGIPDAGPCETGIWGEFEDYAIEILGNKKEVYINPQLIGK